LKQKSFKSKCVTWHSLHRTKHLTAFFRQCTDCQWNMTVFFCCCTLFFTIAFVVSANYWCLRLLICVKCYYYLFNQLRCIILYFIILYYCHVVTAGRGELGSGSAVGSPPENYGGALRSSPPTRPLVPNPSYIVVWPQKSRLRGQRGATNIVFLIFQQ
jgi:hypothetical protein